MRNKKRKLAFLVESYCDDQQESYSDLVAAIDEEQAKDIVEMVRGDYAKVTFAWTVAENLQFARRLAKMTIPEVEASWKQMKREIS